MNKRLLGLAVAGSLVMGAASMATAGVPDTGQSTASSAAGVLYITPAGLGENLGAKGLTVTVTVLDGNGDAIAGYPFQDVTLDDDNNSELFICPGGATADANTDASGVTTFSGQLAGGGSTEAGVRVYLGGNAVTSVGSLLSIDVNSPDLVLDGIVNLSDIGQFTAAFGTPAIDFRIDLVNDNLENLSDIGRFAQALGETCP